MTRPRRYLLLTLIAAGKWPPGVARLGVVVDANASPSLLREAIAAALADDDLLARARAVAAGFDLGVGLRRATDLLETLQHRRDGH